MRNALIFGLFVVVCLFLVHACQPEKVPEKGVYYCEELQIEIDFNIMNMNNTPVCAKIYSDTGEWFWARCMIDYGNGIWICSLDQETSYLTGSFKCKKSSFLVTRYSDGTLFIFEKRE